MASRSLGTLTLDLIAKIGGFTTGMDKAARHAEKRMKEIEDRARKFGKVIGTALAATATAALTGLVALTKQATDAADRINDISQRLGVSTEALSAWGYAAQQSGTDIEALNTGLIRFTKNVAAAVDEGSRQQQMFEALGISVLDAEGNLRSVESLLPEIAQAFKDLDNATLEASLAQELFGRSGTNLLQFLNLGGDGLAEMEEKARSLGIVISQDTASAADEFNDQLNDLTQLGHGAGLMLAQELLPALTDLVQRIREALQEGQPLAKLIEWIGDQAEATSKDFDFMAGTIRDLTNMFGGLYDGAKATLGVLQGIATLDWGKVRQSIREGMEADERIARGFNSVDPEKRVGPAPTTGLEGFFQIPGTGPSFSAVPLTPISPSASNGGRERQLLEFLRDPTGTGSGSKTKSGKSEAEKEAERLAKAYENMNERLREQVALFGQDGEAARLRYELENGELAKLDPLKKQELLQMAEKLDLMREEKEVQDELDAVNERRAESVSQLLDDIAFEQELLGKSAEQQEVLNNLRWAGVDANSAYGQSIIAATEELQKQRDLVDDQITLMDGLRDSARGLADDLKEGVGIWDSLKNAAGRFADVLWEMATNKLIEQALGKHGTAGQGSSGGWIGGLLSAFTSGGGGSSQGSLMDLFSGEWGFANGGWAPANSINRVNERGFEMASVSGRDYLLTGNQPVKVTANSALGGGGDVYSPTFQFLMPQRPDNRTEMHVAQAADRANREAARRNRSGR